jgi:hypothetical protein
MSRTAIGQLEEDSLGQMDVSTDALPDNAAVEQALTSSTETTTGDRNFVNNDNVPSSQESSTSFDCLTEDFLYEDEEFLRAISVHSTITLGDVELDSVDVGSIIVDAACVEWLVRICYCNIGSCCGKTIVRLETGDKDLVRKSQWRKRVYVKDNCIVRS